MQPCLRTGIHSPIDRKLTRRFGSGRELEVDVNFVDACARRHHSKLQPRTHVPVPRLIMSTCTRDRMLRGRLIIWLCAGAQPPRASRTSIGSAELTQATGCSPCRAPGVQPGNNDPKIGHERHNSVVVNARAIHTRAFKMMQHVQAASAAELADIGQNSTAWHPSVPVQKAAAVENLPRTPQT